MLTSARRFAAAGLTRTARSWRTLRSNLRSLSSSASSTLPVSSSSSLAHTPSSGPSTCLPAAAAAAVLGLWSGSRGHALRTPQGARSFTSSTTATFPISSSSLFKSSSALSLLSPLSGNASGPALAAPPVPHRTLMRPGGLGGQGGAWVNPDNVPAGSHLSKFCTDLTAQAREHKLDPMIGREDELRRTIEVLSRRRKNNPILIGEPGVGKTAIIEGLAQRIVANEVPESIKNKRVMLLDLPALVAGAGVRGEFESRFKGVIKDVEEANDVILFVDEVHLLVGAGSAEGSMDASNMLKPVLARGTIQFCGATTLNEYRKYIEKDGALARRFQPVYIPEPSIEDTVSILRGLKDKYELHHKVTILDSAVVAAATYAKRYFTDRKLPDKAIDLLDEAASRLCMQLESKPDAIAALERTILTKKIEVAALKKEQEPASVLRRQTLTARLEKEEAKLQRLLEAWGVEKDRRSAFNRAKTELEQARIDLSNALRSGDFARAGELKHVSIPRLEKQLEDLKQQQLHEAGAGMGAEREAELEAKKAEQHVGDRHTVVDADGNPVIDVAPATVEEADASPADSEAEILQKERAKQAAQRARKRAEAAAEDKEKDIDPASVMLTEFVSDEDIAQVVARHTGIPVSKLMLRERERLLHIEDKLRERVVGQDKAVEAVANCVRIARAGLHSHTKPQGVFLFLGPTGVGKTELAKSLAEFLFDDASAMVRIDMSEYMEKFSVSRLIGAPPGYVGYDEGGMLTEAVRRRPYQIVLFDEIEKAHREVCNILLQVFDEGHLTDSQGRRVDFRNTIVIMTSNLGAGDGAIVSNDADSLARLNKAVRAHFAPEFLNRVDDTVVFKSLELRDMLPIVDIQLRQVRKMLEEKRISLEMSQAARTWLANTGFDPRFGARPLKRTIHTYVLQPLSRHILAGTIHDNSHVWVDVASDPNEGLTFKSAPRDLSAAQEEGEEVGDSSTASDRGGGGSSPRALPPPSDSAGASPKPVGARR